MSRNVYLEIKYMKCYLLFSNFYCFKVSFLSIFALTLPQNFAFAKVCYTKISLPSMKFPQIFVSKGIRHFQNFGDISLNYNLILSVSKMFIYKLLTYLTLLQTNYLVLYIQNSSNKFKKKNIKAGKRKVMPLFS